jgi:hypothetical protein
VRLLSQRQQNYKNGIVVNHGSPVRSGHHVKQGHLHWSQTHFHFAIDSNLHPLCSHGFFSATCIHVHFEKDTFEIRALVAYSNNGVLISQGLIIIMNQWWMSCLVACNNVDSLYGCM